MFVFMCWCSVNTKKISLEQFRCIAVLGRGHFGKVGIALFTYLVCKCHFRFLLNSTVCAGLVVGFRLSVLDHWVLSIVNPSCVLTILAQTVFVGS